MAISRPCYTTRERVKRSLDVKPSAYADWQVDAAIEAASDTVEGCLHRRFYPEAATRYFDWPDPVRSLSWRLWLNQHELVSVSAIVSGGTALTADQYFLRPESGPPFTHVEINLDTNAAFEGGDTHQRAIAIAGVYAGCPDRTAPAGALAEALDSSETAVDVTDSASIGVGDLVLAGSERMLIVDRRMLDTGQNLQLDLPAQTASTSVRVSDGTGFNVGETILLDAERMLIVDIAGNTLVVKRAWDGTVLATHSGSDIYAPRTLTVMRGALGTVAAAHDAATALARQVYPALVAEYATGEALNTLLQEQSGYARTVGSGEAVREASGGGLDMLREQAYTAYGRKARKRAV